MRVTLAISDSQTLLTCISSQHTAKLCTGVAVVGMSFELNSQRSARLHCVVCLNAIAIGGQFVGTSKRRWSARKQLGNKLNHRSNQSRERYTNRSKIMKLGMIEQFMEGTEVQVSTPPFASALNVISDFQLGIKYIFVSLKLKYLLLLIILLLLFF